MRLRREERRDKARRAEAAQGDRGVVKFVKCVIAVTGVKV